jgi:hypothetical protein
VTTLYKIVGMDGEPLHGGAGKWFLPEDKRAGEWMPKVADVVACRRGYHLIPATAMVDWLPPSCRAGLLFEAEGRGDQSSDGEKIAFAESRLLGCVGILDEVSMRLAAADFAERVLPIFEKEHPKDKRPREAIQAARDFALGKINAAARDAARAAAWDASAAARDAARAASAAAWDAARAAHSKIILKHAAERLREMA